MSDKVYERRFSEHHAFWVFFGILVLIFYVRIYFRLADADPRGIASAVWLVLCCIMTGLCFIARRTHIIESSLIRRWTDNIGSLWFLFVFYAFVIIVIFDAARALLNFTLPALTELSLSFAASALFLACGVKQAFTIHTTKLTVETEKLPEDRDSLRIVQITDLHLGPYCGVRLLEQILRRVSEAEPDMVVVTGDLADGRLDGRGHEITMFRQIRPSCGFFAVTGNHDYYDDIGKAVEFMEHCGMRVLQTEAVCAGGIVVAGLDDRDHMIMERWSLTRSETLIVNTHSKYRDKFLLVLRHRPIVELGTEGLFDLQLSGHTHGGQLFPLWTSRLFFGGHSRGFKKLRGGSMLYTSNGAGYVGPPVRLFAPPEVVVIDLVKKVDTSAAK